MGKTMGTMVATRAVMAAASMALVAGCAGGGSLADVKTAHDTHGGSRRAFDVPAPAAYAAAVAVMHEEHADTPIEEHAAEGWAMGTRRPSFPTRYGAFVGVWVRETAPGRSEVEVITKRTEHTYFIGVTESTMLEEIGKRLAKTSPETSK